MISENFRSQAFPKFLQAQQVLGVKLNLTSGVRSKAKNDSLAGASKTSAHLDGLAVDFVPVGMSLQDAYQKLSTNSSFMSNVDQLILEEKNGCIHIGMAKSGEARRELRRQTGVGQYDLASDGVIGDAAREFGVSANLIKKIMTLESGGKDNAKSWGDALGSMQILESTWEGVRKKVGGLDKWDVGARDKKQATRVASYLLGKLSRKYGDDYLVYAAYGNGEALVDKALRLQKENPGSSFKNVLASLRYEATLRRQKGFTPRESVIKEKFGGDIRRVAEAGRQEVLRSAERFEKSGSSETIDKAPIQQKAIPGEELEEAFWTEFGQPKLTEVLDKFDENAVRLFAEKFRGILEQPKAVRRQDIPAQPESRSSWWRKAASRVFS